MGKTFLFADVIKTFLEQNPDKKVMVLAERDKIVTQAHETIGKLTGKRVEIEMADHHVDMRGFFAPQIVVGTVQTQARGGDGLGRLGKFDPMDFGLVVVDECHHAVAGQYRKLLDYYMQNPDLRVLGVTATPDRLDKQAMGKVFEATACDYNIKFGYDEGWLLFPYQQFIKVSHLDISHVGKVGDDFNAGELSDALEKERPLIEIARACIDHCEDKKTIVFTVSVKQAEALTNIINSPEFKPGSARFVCGATPKEERAKLYDDYKHNRFQFLVNCSITVEGWDDPEVTYIVDAAPTLSRAKYTQKLGRMLRPAAEIAHLLNDHDSAVERKRLIAQSSKPRAVYFDLAANSFKHKPIFIGDVLGGDYSDKVIDRARKAALSKSDRNENVNMEEELEKAKRELEAAEKRTALRRAKLKAKAEYSLESVDPFNVFDIRRPAGPTQPQHSHALSEKQQKILNDQGVKGWKNMTLAEQHAILDRIYFGWKNGMASYRQTQLLKRWGITAPMTREAAKAMIDERCGRINEWRKGVQKNG